MTDSNGTSPSYVVGIGGSAGGLEAFEEFFSNMPPDAGMAFVVVQHLDPDHKAMLAELLQRSTAMPVVEIADGMQVHPDTVYVIPPNRDLSILHGVLQLLEPSARRGQRLPIDYFFRQLAEDQGDRAVAVILSGMGTDGTSGLKAVKEELGMVMVQDPDSAKFDGMPRSALATGMTDYVAPVRDLPQKLLEYTTHSSVATVESPVVTERAPNALQRILALLRAQTGNEFSLYKKDTLQRRIKRRMDVHLIGNIDDYRRYLQDNTHEVQLLFKELLIGITSFFRDAGAFEAFKQGVNDHLLKRAQEQRIIRAWVIGCATGEEAYSLAMILRECADTLDRQGGIGIQVFATDIDNDAIDVARRGVYAENIAADVSPERLQRFFVKEDDRYRVKREIRDSIVFAAHNVTMDPPFTKMDVVSCRNLLIYFSPDLQKKVIPLLHYSVNAGGILFLGPSESIAGYADLFSTLDSKAKVFRSREQPGHRHAAVEFPSSRRHAGPNIVEGDEQITHTGVSEIARNILMEGYTPPAVLINEQGDILYVNGRTGKYLEPATGKVNWNIYAMAREGLRYDLSTGVRRAINEDADVTVKGITVKTDSYEQAIDLTVRPLAQVNGAQNLLLVVFEEVQPSMRARTGEAAGGPDSQQSATIAHYEEELRLTQQRLQECMEQTQASREELQSANEELQSSNEELQSTNEELMTSKEELQSLNEELATVNGELQEKVEMLSVVNNDMRNLLNSTEIATLFLDNHLNIRGFTPHATNIIKIIESDVGRPVTDLVSNLKHDGLVADATEVLATLVYKERQVQTTDEKWYIMRIMPYRTTDNVIDGVVVTFSEITLLKELEQSLLDERNLAEGIVATVREPLLVLDSDLRVVAVSKSFSKVFQVTPEETEGSLLYELGNRQWDIPALRALLEIIVPENSEMNDFLVEHDFPVVGHKEMLLNARCLQRRGEAKPLILLAIEDTTGSQSSTSGPR